MRVRIGNILFEQSFLEDGSRFLEYLGRARKNPKDLEAQLALGVIHEYHGRPAQAISHYWSAYQLDPTDTFVQERLKELLAHLQRIITEKVS
ncbi:tetratricopeptide repeat protein [Moorellaceae bacterium AZ2]